MDTSRDLHANMQAAAAETSRFLVLVDPPSPQHPTITAAAAARESAAVHRC